MAARLVVLTLDVSLKVTLLDVPVAPAGAALAVGAAATAG